MGNSITCLVIWKVLCTGSLDLEFFIAKIGVGNDMWVDVEVGVAKGGKVFQEIVDSGCRCGM